jgi:hypothetical protein
LDTPPSSISVGTYDSTVTLVKLTSAPLYGMNEGRLMVMPGQVELTRA